MQFGLCAGLDRLSLAVAAGFDYLEPSVTSVASMSEAEFAAARARVEASPIGTPSFNVLFPGELSLMTDDDAAIQGYLQPALARVSALGGQLVVFGSGRSRRRPDSMPYGKAYRRLVHVARLIGDVAAVHGLTVAVEPLRTAENNIIVTIAEGADFVAAVDHPQVALLADYYHISESGEPADDLLRVGGVSHVHVAAKSTRAYPLVEEPGLVTFLSALRQSGYQGRVSIEGGSDHPEQDGPAALALLKRLAGEE